MSHKERQDIELCAQRATLQQQRSHIDILESALAKAQLQLSSADHLVNLLVHGPTQKQLHQKTPEFSLF